MKHILNNLSEYEKNVIREQHKDKLTVNTLNFQKNLNKRLGDITPLINEQTAGSEINCSYFMSKKTGTLTYKGGGSFTAVNGTPIGAPLNNVFELGDGFGRGELTGDYTYEYKFGPTMRRKAGEHYLELKDPKGGSATVFLIGCPKPVQNQTTSGETTGQQEIKTITNKVASEGIKNILPGMISDPPFEGTYSGYVFGGVYNGVRYQWDCSGVEGMSGVRGMIDGKIITENNTFLPKLKITDGNPKGMFVGFVGGSTKLVCYVTTENKLKVAYY
jgi:hypothetical protein